jgi:hypothetical protein
LDDEAMNAPNQSPPVLIQQVCFHAWEFGLKTQDREKRLHEDATSQVTAWLNTRGGTVTVLHVAMTQGDLGAHATVWFVPQA